MKQLTLPFSIIALSLVLLALHVVAGEMYFYWIYWWYDVMMHWFGGFVIGLFSLWVLYRQAPVLVSTVGKRIVASLASVIVIGLLWEYFEYIIGSHHYEVLNSYGVDTTMDVAMDVAGALTAAVLVRFS